MRAAPDEAERLAELVRIIWPEHTAEELTMRFMERLPEIRCPTLVIGGTDDRIVTGEASHELAARIPGAALQMYAGLGHGLYEEAPDFLRRVADFCR